MPTIALLALFTVVVACGSSGSLPVDTSNDNVGDNNNNVENNNNNNGPDPTDAVFELDNVLDVSIELPDEDWDLLRRQSRSFFSVLGPTCNISPPERPYTYFPAKVTVNGEVFDNVGVRKKGFFGSLDVNKPSLKIKFSEYVSGLRYQGLSRLTLNNNKSDPSHIKQCLGYAIFAGVGLVAPRCNFARVRINGVELGVFSNIESVKPRFLRRNYGSDAGNLYEGALSDFRPGWVNSFQKKNNKVADDRSDIEALVTPVEDTASDIFVAVGDDIDLDRFLTFWATEVLIAHLDGYARNTNNFYIYRDPSTGLFDFIPWGIDSIMVGGEIQLPWENVAVSEIAWTVGALARRLYNDESARTAFLDRLQTLVDAWDEESLLAEVDAMEELIAPWDERDAVATAASIDDVRTFINERRDRLQGAMMSPLPEPGAQLRGEWCLGDIGSLDATFSTTWGSNELADPFTQGSTDVTLVINSVTTTYQSQTATAGLDEEGRATITFLGYLDANTLRGIIVTFDPALWVAGATLNLDGSEAEGTILDLDLTAMPQPTITIVALLGGGTITFEQGSAVADAPVSGTITDGVVYESFF
jgi:hypothetical protein